jgi:hypothetical protein
MVVQGVKPFIERLLAQRTEVPLATVRGFAMFMSARVTAEPTFHRSCLELDVSLLYSTHHILTHYHRGMIHAELPD